MNPLIRNVDAVVVALPHPKDCPVCGGGELSAAPMRWRSGRLLPAWPAAQLVPCPWPYGVGHLLSTLGVAPAGPEDGAA